jgi:2,3-diketo-5-methylthio-1-phosphopentane phosphatase
LLALGQEIRKLMDADSKTSGLKALQGLIWRSGFESGELVAHVYGDVPAALEHWHRQAIAVRIYSSGSCEAQRLFFSHTDHGDLEHWFEGHYDTTIGPKRDRASYERIAQDWGRPAEKLLFISDVTAELAAASAAGMQVLLSIRPGNPAQQDSDRWPSITSFAEIAIGQPV